MPTDVTQTFETAGVTGRPAGTSDGTAHVASNQQTVDLGSGGGTGGIDNNVAATQPDTTAIAGGVASHHVVESPISGTLETSVAGGSPITHANPAYRAPVDIGQGASTRDTSLTDLPISDGQPRDQTPYLATAYLDTINQVVPLQTTTANVPAAPNAPTVAAGLRSALVTITQVSDAVGARTRGYRVEALQLLPGRTEGNLNAGTGVVGTAFAPVALSDDDPRTLAATTSVVVWNLVPSNEYVFRVAAYNDNGQSDYSDYSAAVVPLNPDAPGPGTATALLPEYRTAKVYMPDGTLKPGSGGTCGPVQSLAATAVSDTEASVTFNQASYNTPVSYEVKAYLADGTLAESASSTDLSGGVTVALTALTAETTYTIVVTPLNANGRGISASTTVTTQAAPPPP